MVETGYEVVWTKRSQKQVRQVFKHISKDSLKNASKVIQEIAEAVHNAIPNPQIYGSISIRLTTMGAIGHWKSIITGFHFSFLLILSLTIFSCSSNNDKSRIVEISADSLKQGPIVHDTLSTEQIENIKKIQLTFSEVNSSTLSETITNFKRDLHPDNEISIWLTMAAAYEKFLSSKKGPVDITKKQEAYKLILLRSMMPEDEAKSKAAIKLLNDKEVAEIFVYYNKAPKPITVVQKQ